MSSKEPNVVAYIVHRGRKAVFIGLFRLNGLGVHHLGFQVRVELIQLISPFLQSCGGREICSFGRAGFDDVLRMWSLQGKKQGDTGGG